MITLKELNSPKSDRGTLRNQGFTLLEMMVVIMIIGILSTSLVAVSYTHLTLPTICSV